MHLKKQEMYLTLLDQKYQIPQSSVFASIQSNSITIKGNIRGFKSKTLPLMSI